MVTGFLTATLASLQQGASCGTLPMDRPLGEVLHCATHGGPDFSQATYCQNRSRIRGCHNATTTLSTLLLDALGVCGGCPEQVPGTSKGAAIDGSKQSRETRQEIFNQSLPYCIYWPDRAGIYVVHGINACRGSATDCKHRNRSHQAYPYANHTVVAGLRQQGGADTFPARSRPAACETRQASTAIGPTGAAVDR